MPTLQYSRIYHVKRKARAALMSQALNLSPQRTFTEALHLTRALTGIVTLLSPPLARMGTPPLTLAG
jgi:hypothetical protein